MLSQTVKQAFLSGYLQFPNAFPLIYICPVLIAVDFWQLVQVNMAEGSLTEGEDENILYDLLIITEWPPETDTQVSQTFTFARFQLSLWVFWRNIYLKEIAPPKVNSNWFHGVSRSKPRSTNILFPCYLSSYPHITSAHSVVLICHHNNSCSGQLSFIRFNN